MLIMPQEINVTMNSTHPITIATTELDEVFDSQHSRDRVGTEKGGVVNNFTAGYISKTCVCVFLCVLLNTHAPSCCDGVTK